MRTKTVNVNGKSVVINESRISELKGFVTKYKDEFSEIVKANTVDDVTKAVGEIFYSKLPELFPVLTAEDIDNAYPSELEDLIGAFVDVNFLGVKKVGTPIVQTMLSSLKKSQPSA